MAITKKELCEFLIKPKKYNKKIWLYYVENIIESLKFKYQKERFLKLRNKIMYYFTGSTKKENKSNGDAVLVTI